LSQALFLPESQSLKSPARSPGGSSTHCLWTHSGALHRAKESIRKF